MIIMVMISMWYIVKPLKLCGDAAAAIWRTQGIGHGTCGRADHVQCTFLFKYHGVTCASSNV